MLARTLFLLSCLVSPSAAASSRSAVHFGISGEDQSSTGFDKSIGSALLLDALVAVGQNVEIGVSTLAFGAENENSRFYRLGAGPTVVFSPVERWLGQVTPYFFQETGSEDDGDARYRSRGYGLQIGWERVFQIRERLQFVWGGFLGYHWGSMSHDASVSPAGPVSSARWTTVETNRGTNRGVEFALRMEM